MKKMIEVSKERMDLILKKKKMSVNALGIKLSENELYKGKNIDTVNRKIDDIRNRGSASPEDFELICDILGVSRKYLKGEYVTNVFALPDIGSIKEGFLNSFEYDCQGNVYAVKGSSGFQEDKMNEWHKEYLNRKAFDRLIMQLGVDLDKYQKRELYETFLRKLAYYK